MFDRLRSLFARPPHVCIHPVFGELRYNCPPRTWRGKLARGDNALCVAIDGTKQQPHQQLLDLAAMVVGRLDEFERLALTFQSTVSHGFATERLNLIELSVLYPAKEWLQRAKSSLVKAGRPIFVLVFSISNDRNVLDLVFADEIPVDIDYH